MESSRFMRGLPSAENFFRRLTEKGYKPRVGQRAFWNIVNTDAKTLYLGVLPTGYGKSDTALGTFMILMEQRRVNRMPERWPASSRQRFGSAKWILCRLGSVCAVAGPHAGRAFARPG